MKGGENMQKHCGLKLRNANFLSIFFSILTMKTTYFMVLFFLIRTHNEFLALKFFPLINKINISCGILVSWIVRKTHFISGVDKEKD